jgi:hypothetical protein
MSSDLQSFVGGKYTPYPVRGIARRDRYESDKKPTRKTSSIRGARSVYTTDELCWFGIRIMQITLAQFRNRVVTACVLVKGLVNKTIFGEFVSEATVGLRFRRRVDSMPLPQLENDGFRGHSGDPHFIEDFEDEPINSRHPRDHR